MRFSLTDLLIAMGTTLTGTFIGVMAAHSIGRPQWDILSALIFGLLAYLLLTPLIYRRFKLRPLLFPQCPKCKDKNRGYYFASAKPDWPKDHITCAACQTDIDLWYEAPKHQLPSAPKHSFQLLWPQSWGRWRNVSKR